MENKMADPFSEFGGKVIKSDPKANNTNTEDPFKSFGGSIVSKKVSGQGAESTLPSSSNGSNNSPSFLQNTQQLTNPLSQQPNLSYAPITDPKLRQEQRNQRINIPTGRQAIARDNTNISIPKMSPLSQEETLAQEKDAYYNPEIKSNYKSGDKRLDFVYNHPWLMDVPVLGDKIKDEAYQIAIRSKGAQDVENIDEVRKGNPNYNGNAIFSDSSTPRVNLVDQYFGKIRLPSSKYKPKSDYLEFLPSVSVKGQFDKKHQNGYDMSEILNSVAGKSDNLDFSKPIYKNEQTDSKLAEELGVDLGGHKTGIGFDKERGLPYVSISDAWDFSPKAYNGGESAKDGGKQYIQASLMHKAGHPFKIYDRLYFDPKTNQYISDDKLPKVKDGGNVADYKNTKQASLSTNPSLRIPQQNIVTKDQYPTYENPRHKEISESLAKIRSELPKDAQANWDEAVNLSATRPVDNLREPTQEELAHERFMQTPLGKTLGTIAYLGSKATKGTLQVAKGTAWLMNKAGLSGAPIQAAGNIMNDLAFDKADEAANYGLTKNDQSRFDQNKITSNLGGVAEFLPAMAAGGPTFYLQGMGMGKETADQAEKSGVKINPNVKDAFILGTGIANGFLMKALGEGVFSKLPAGLRSDIASKISMDAIKEASGKELTGEQFQSLINNGVKDWGQKVQQTGLNALKGYNKAVVDLSALSGANFALKKGVDVANDKPVFNESLGDLAENVSNVATEQAPFFAGLGQISNLGKLTKYSDYKNSVTESLMNDPSPENVDRVKQALHDHGFDQTKQDQWTPEEMDATFKQVDNIADVAKKLPRNIPEKKIGDAVDLVQGRDELKRQLADEQGNRQQLDESVNEMPTPHEQLLIDKIDQANDKLRDIVSGKKTTYSIEKGEDGKEDKYFKKVDGKVEPIEKSRYELENIERESKKQSNEQPNESVSTENTIPETPQTNETGVPETISEKPVETTENNISQAENEITPTNVVEQTTGAIEPNKGAGVEVEKAKDEPINTNETVSKKPRTAEAIKNENTKAKAEEAGIELNDHVGETRTNEVIDKEATKELKNGYDSHELVRKILEDKHQASDTEVAILAKHTATVEKNYQDLTKKLETDGANMNKHDFDTLTAEHEQAIKDYQDALNADVKTGTGTARALSARRFAVKNNFSLGQMIKNKRAANGGEKLSSEQVKDVTQRFNEIQEANEKLQARIEKLETENARIKAEKAIKRIKEGESRLQRKAITKEALAEDRKKIAEEFSAKLKAMRQSGALNSAGKATFEFLQAAAPYVAKMVRNLALEGVTEIKDIVSRVKEELDLKDLTDREVTDLIGGVYNEKRGTKSDLESQIRDLRTQARLMSAIEDAEAGLAKAKTPSPKASEKVKELRQRLDELQKGTPPTKEETSLKLSKAATQKRIVELERRIREKDFSKPETNTVQPDQELITLRRKADRLMEDYQLQLAKDELANRTKIEKLKDNLLNIASLPRALKASLDFSAVLRQGLFATAGHPKEALTAFKEMFRQTFSEEKYKNWISDLKHEPIYDLMQKSDLYLSDKNNAKLLAREEEFTSNLADKIPGIGKFIEASERAYTGYLNVLRAGVFTSEAQNLIRKGYTFENNPEQFKALAKVVNVLTGRGDIPEFLGGKQPRILSSALFSPRFMAARIQTLYLWADPRLPKEAKILAAKDIGTTLASGAVILSLASLAGYKVQIDPRSVNFLKIQDKQEHGSTFYDILGGLPQYVRFLAQQGLGEKIPSKGNGIITFGSKKARGTTRLSEAARFLRGKLSPVTGGALNLMEGKDVLGQPYHLWPNVPLEFVPLPYTDVQEAYKVGGIDAAIKAFIPSQFGVGVSSYDPNAKHSKLK